MLEISDIHELMKKYKFRPSKKFGQNFLIDNSVLSKIVVLSKIEDKEVIEIGPGLGSLTLKLLNHADKVDAYEVDKRMIRVLKGERKEKHFTLHEEDFLDADLNFQNTKTLVANIPYNITSDILFKIFQNSFRFDRAIIMVQKEVADRLIAKPKTKAYGKLAVTTGHFCKVEKLFDVPKEAFYPAPKVTSSVVELEMKNVNYNESTEFMSFVKNMFAHQRKTLFNNLKGFKDSIIMEEIFSEFITNNKLEKSVRPQELSQDLIYKLYNMFS